MSSVVVPLLDLVALKGEEEARRILTGFSCNGLNDEVESYLKDTALRHTRKNTSVTHLVMTPDCSECLAYYTLAIKPFAITASRLNNKQKKEMRDVAKMRKDALDPSNKNFLISAYLIAQLGRNFAAPKDAHVTGRDLFAIIFSQINAIRNQVGGKVVFVEYEKSKPKLLEFYQKHGFQEFKVPSDGIDNEKLGQMFYFMNDESAEGHSID